MSKLKVKITDAVSKARWKAIEDSSWEVEHTWPTWKFGGDLIFPDQRMSRREIKTLEDLHEFLKSENLPKPDSNKYEVEVHGCKFMFIILGNKVEVFKPTILYIVENE